MPSASTETTPATCTVYRVWSAPKGTLGRRLLFTTYHPDSVRVFLYGSRHRPGLDGVKRKGWHPSAEVDAPASEPVLEQPAHHHAALLGVPCRCEQCKFTGDHT